MHSGRCRWVHDTVGDARKEALEEGAGREVHEGRCREVGAGCRVAECVVPAGRCIQGGRFQEEVQDGRCREVQDMGCREGGA